MNIIACVPNISEGRDKKLIKKITTEIAQTQDVQLLGVESGQAVNRTVITFVGKPEAVEEAAFKCIKKASQLIDMSKHKGKHIRQGCVDVCPFVPLYKASLESCAEIARHLASRVGGELAIPVYLYGAAASDIARQDLSYLRKGQYEALAIKLQNIVPDAGPSKFTQEVKKSGAICIGARDCLLAYNINLKTKNIEETKKLAKILKAKISNIKTLGWYIDEYGFCQVSINVEDYKKAPLYLIYETCKTEAQKIGLKVTGSELIGLAPKDAILNTAKFYLNKQGKITLGMAMKDIVDVVVNNLHLDDIAPFDMNEKILEMKLKSQN